MVSHSDNNKKKRTRVSLPKCISLRNLDFFTHFAEPHTHTLTQHAPLLQRPLNFDQINKHKWCTRALYYIYATRIKADIANSHLRNKFRLERASQSYPLLPHSLGIYIKLKKSSALQIFPFSNKITFPTSHKYVCAHTYYIHHLNSNLHILYLFAREWSMHSHQPYTHYHPFIPNIYIYITLCEPNKAPARLQRLFDLA